MFNGGFKSEKKASTVPPVTTILGAGTRWQGELNAGTGTLRVEGELDGMLSCEGTVQVEVEGHLKGTTQTRHLTVTGRVDGIIHVAERLEILRHGWVEGEVDMGTLVVDEGGTLQGNCTRFEPAKAKEPVPLVPRKEEVAWAEFPHSQLPDAQSTAKSNSSRSAGPSGRGRF
jgi:cytoskeletal protein CcmA (bactofilin family)